MGPFETVAGLEVIRNDSKHIPQVGGPDVVFVGGFVEALAPAGAFPLPFTFGSCAAELDYRASGLHTTPHKRLAHQDALYHIAP